MTDRKILAVDIVPPAKFGDMAAVFAKTEGSTEMVKLFSYFHDEISFTSAELIGLTVDQANRLYHEKDVAYLRS
jgi:hypothetical protein